MRERIITPLWYQACENLFGWTEKDTQEKIEQLTETEVKMVQSEITNIIQSE